MTPGVPLSPASLNRATEAAQRVMRTAVQAGEFPCAVAAVFTTHGDALTVAESGTDPARPDSLFMVAS
ncbi:MAG TPA: hypothetical protein VHN99_05020, partial [Deinococcales bacterium]|nr:hypothetical protein [Deinococcales bacterium]